MDTNTALTDNDVVINNTESLPLVGEVIINGSLADAVATAIEWSKQNDGNPVRIVDFPQECPLLYQAAGKKLGLRSGSMWLYTGGSFFGRTWRVQA